MFLFASIVRCCFIYILSDTHIDNTLTILYVHFMVVYVAHLDIEYHKFNKG